MDKYLFSIPDSYGVRLLNRSLLIAIRKYPEWFYDDFIIDTAYGCSPKCIWNGGRKEADIGNRKGWTGEVLKMYDSFGVKYRLVFTNLLLRKEHLSDYDGNELCKVADQLGSYVMVSIPILAEYIKRKYKNAKVCWSTTTKFGKTTEDIIKRINELSRDTLVVLPYQYNNKPEVDKLEHPGNIEVLINEMCIDNCPFRRKHWEDVSRAVLRHSTEVIENGLCRFYEKYSDPHLLREHQVSREKLPWYMERGIFKFKISGRHDPDQCYQSYVDYMVKPEKEQIFQDFARRYEELFLKGDGTINEEI